MTHWNGILLFYSLTYYGVGLDGVIRVVNYTISGSNHTNETYLFSGLQEYTEYEFLVAAHTSVGRGHAASVSARTLESGISFLMQLLMKRTYSLCVLGCGLMSVLGN